jgi:DNA-binding LacI/PurR family transcriptional regulator
MRGYSFALLLAGIEVDRAYWVSADGVVFAGVMRAVKTLFYCAQRPTAIFAVSDTLAIGVLRGLHESGLSVPEHMAVMGFDDIALAQQTYPALTTVAQPMRTLGEHAAFLLLRRLEDPAARANGVLLPHRLVLRESA